jgi:hypothetical protein
METPFAGEPAASHSRAFVSLMPAFISPPPSGQHLQVLALGLLVTRPYGLGCDFITFSKNETSQDPALSVTFIKDVFDMLTALHSEPLSLLLALARYSLVFYDMVVTMRNLILSLPGKINSWHNAGPLGLCGRCPWFMTPLPQPTPHSLPL